MILKVKVETYTPSYSVAWIFVDGVTRLRQERLPQRAAEELNWDCCWPGEEPPKPVAAATPDLFLALACKIHEQDKLIVCREAYLLSDDGKTIERL